MLVPKKGYNNILTNRSVISILESSWHFSDSPRKKNNANNSSQAAFQQFQKKTLLVSDSDFGDMRVLRFLKLHSQPYEVSGLSGGKHQEGPKILGDVWLEVTDEHTLLTAMENPHFQ